VRIFQDFVREQRPNDNLEREENQIESYLLLPYPSMDADRMKWWTNKLKFSNLYELSKKYLCLPASSASSERVFSKAGEVLSKKRSSLTENHVNDIVLSFNKI
jgi:zinc finger BED domain-containing protein 1 (E3 SUMO-protein ligase ZBED1)